jgi:hypothetical protein
MTNIYHEVLKDIYGISLEDAHKSQTCIACKVQINKSEYNQTELSVYLADGLCKPCYHSTLSNYTRPNPILRRAK